MTIKNFCNDNLNGVKRRFDCGCSGHSCSKVPQICNRVGPTGPTGPTGPVIIGNCKTARYKGKTK